MSGRAANVDIGMIPPSLIAKAEQLTGMKIPVEAHKKTEVRQVPLNGRKRSLLVGINYAGTQNELHGCVNDVKRMLPVLQRLGFAQDSSSQRVLLDGDGSSEEKPTRANMLTAMKWLVEGAKPGDALFFHYSGHGGQEPAEGTSDGYHETLVPLDFQTAGMLNDVDIFDALVKSLPSGCRLTCILDSCHSAGALNLPFRFVGTEAELKKGLAGEAMHMVMSKSWSDDIAKWKDGQKMDLLKDVGAMGLGLWKLKQQANGSAAGDSTGFKVEEEQNVGLQVGEVVAFTGCRSDQTSADVGDVSQQFHLQPVGNDSRGSLVIDSQRAKGAAAGAGGALTTALLEALEKLAKQKMSYLEMLEEIRKELASLGFTQVPQVVTSLVVDLNQNFALDTVQLPDESQPAGDKDAAGSDENGCPALAGFLSALSGHPHGAQMLQPSSQGTPPANAVPIFQGSA